MKKHSTTTVLALLFISFVLSSCSFLGISSDSKGPLSKERESLAPSKMPFKLEIVDEVNDGQRLHILGAVSAETSWALDEAVVRLTGIKSGGVVGLSYLPLSRMPIQQDSSIQDSARATDVQQARLIRPGQKYQFSLSIPADDITDYQLELLWGKEARDYLSSAGSALTGSLEIRKIEVETTQEACNVIDCEISYKISADIFNGTDRVISKAVLGVGFIRNKQGQELDLSSRIPENEEQVEIPDLNLASGTSRPLRLKFESPVPASQVESPEGRLRPRIRIVKFN